MNFLKIPIAVFLSALATVTIAQDFTLNPADGLPDLGRGTAVWADFNNDGLLDVAMTGINSSGIKEGGIYSNNGDGTFSNAGVALTPVSDGDLAVSDFNNDGLLDLLLTGSDATDTEVTQLYKNQGSYVFTLLPFSFQGVAGGASFIHLTHDGKADIVITGVNNSDQRITRVYQNNGNETFTLISSGIIGTSNGDLLVDDFNSDGYDDVLITGLNSTNSRVNRLYTNNKAGGFQLTATVLPLVRMGGIASADVNADGFTDVFISGNDSGGANIGNVYTNNAGAGFVLMKSVSPIVNGGGAWGDFNNDGFADLTFFGFHNPDLKGFVFTNSAGSDLVDSGNIFPGFSSGSATWADYNNDNKLDILLNGYPSSGTSFTSLYTSNVAAANTPPAIPTNLHFTGYADSVVLAWDAPTDNETPSAGLTYEVYIGSSPGASDILAPLSNKNTGKRKVAASGIVRGTSFTIKDLPEGAYYWSVQAVDPAFGASAFATEQSFASCNEVAITGTSVVCYNTPIDLAAGTATDDIDWYAAANPSVILNTGNTLDITITVRDTIVAEVTKQLGCIVYDTIVVDVMPLPTVDVGPDVNACLNDEIEIEAVTSAVTVRWFAEGDPSSIGAINPFAIVFINDTTIVAEVEDSNGCINYDSVSIALLPQPVVSLGSDVEMCLFTEMNFTAGIGTDSVNWFSENNGLLVAGSFDYMYRAEAPDVIWTEVYNSEGCASRDSVAIQVFQLPVADAGEDKLICDGHTVTIGRSNVAGLAFLWQPAATLSAEDVSDPVAIPLDNTEYVLTVTDENSCVDTDTVIVYIDPVSTIETGGDKVICFGEAVTLGGDPTASGSTLPYSFTWFPETGLDDMTSPNPEAAPEATIVYGIQTKTGDCVVDTSYVTVTVNPLPPVSAGEDIMAGQGETIQFSASGAVNYVWVPEELFEDNAVPDPVIVPNRNTTYVVTGTDANGCQNTDSVMVTLRSELFVPGLFTPNDDGNNDIFRVHGFGIERITLKVYDRWGRLVFSSDQLEEGWDGRINGANAEPGSYVWAVEGHYFDGNPVNFRGQDKGIVKLLR